MSARLSQLMTLVRVTLRSHINPTLGFPLRCWSACTLRMCPKSQSEPQTMGSTVRLIYSGILPSTLKYRSVVFILHICEINVACFAMAYFAVVRGEVKLRRWENDLWWPGVGGEGGMNGGPRGCLGQRNYSVWHWNGACMSFDFCPDPESVHHQSEP